MPEDFVYRVSWWLVPVGVLAFLGLIVWWTDSPLKPWWAACLTLAVLVSIARNAWLAARRRRSNDRGVAALRAGELPTTPPPEPRARVLAVLCVQLAFALAGFVLLVVDLFRRFA
jgi:hypothetical protein